MAGKKPKPRGWAYKPGSPLTRGFDTRALFREDYLRRTRWLSEELTLMQVKLEKAKGKLSAREKQNRKIKKELREIQRNREQRRFEAKVAGWRPASKETVKVQLPWKAFFELHRKYPNRVLDNVNHDRVLFTDGAVILQISFSPLGQPSHFVIH